MTITVGAFEAKTKFSELLDKVEAGEVVIITRRGKEVARIAGANAGRGGLPSERSAELDALLRLADRFKEVSEGTLSSADINEILYDKDGLPK